MFGGWLLTLVFCFLTATGIDASTSESIGNLDAMFDEHPLSADGQWPVLWQLTSQPSHHRHQPGRIAGLVANSETS